MELQARIEIQANLVKELGIFALKALLTINSGASLAIVAIAMRQSEAISELSYLHQLQTALWCFLGGIVFVFMAIAVTYVSVQRSLSRIGSEQPPKLAIHLLGMMAPAVMSFASFIAGSFFVIRATSTS